MALLSRLVSRDGARRLLVPRWVTTSITALLLVGCQVSFEDHLADARALQKSGHFSESIAPLREAVRERADDPESNFLLGLALARSGEPTLATWPLAKAAASPEYAVTAGVLLASSLLATRNASQAVEALDLVLVLAPNHRVAIALRARANFANHRPEEAVRDAARVLAVEPENSGALETLAFALISLKRFAEAEAHLGRLDELTGEAEPAVAARICAGRAAILQERGESEQAEDTLRDCLEVLPADPVAIRFALEFFDQTERPEMSIAVLRSAVEASPKNLRLRARLAEGLRSIGEEEEGEQLLRVATVLDPSPDAWRALGEFHRRGQDPQAARRAFERALQLAGDEAEELSFTYADLLVDLGEIDRAEAIALGLTESVYSQLIRGRILLQQGDPKAALEALDAGIRVWPNNPGARYLAGQAAELLGDFKRALSEYREAVRAGAAATDAGLSLAELHHSLGDHDSALEFAVGYARSHPTAVRGYVVAARAATALGNYDFARGLLGRLKRFEGAEVTSVVERAAVERAADGPKAAAEVVERSGLDLSEPEYELALRSLVEDLLAQERYEWALNRVGALIARRPNAAHLHAARGIVLQRAGGSAEEVRRAFERALEIDGEHVGAIVGLAGLAWHQQDVSRAVELFDQATNLEPAEPSYAYASAQLLLARGRTSEAERRLRSLVARHPRHASACNDLAWILAETRDHLEFALELAVRATLLEPGPNTYDTLGWVRLRRGEFEAAADALAQAVQGNSTLPGMWYRLGLALEAKGDRRAAVRAIEKALESGSFPEAEAARAKIAQLSVR